MWIEKYYYQFHAHVIAYYMFNITKAPQWMPVKQVYTPRPRREK